MVDVMEVAGRPAQAAAAEREALTGCVITHLCVHDGAAALDFYTRALGAVEEMRAPSPDGQRIWHASLTFGNTKLFLADDFSEGNGMRCAAPKALGGSSALMFFYVPDADAAFHRAVAAGAEVVSPLEDMFWGDRCGKVRDPFGHEWVFATPIKQ